MCRGRLWQRMLDFGGGGAVFAAAAASQFFFFRDQVQESCLVTSCVECWSDSNGVWKQRLSAARRFDWLTRSFMNDARLHVADSNLGMPRYPTSESTKHTPLPMSGVSLIFRSARVPLARSIVTVTRYLAKTRQITQRNVTTNLAQQKQTGPEPPRRLRRAQRNRQRQGEQRRRRPQGRRARRRQRRRPRRRRRR